MRMRPRAIVATLVLASLVLTTLFPGQVGAQLFIAAGRDTLRQLPGVEVVVEVAAGLRHPELEGAALRRAVEDRLRAGGITIYPGQAANPSTAKAYVYVRLTDLPLPGALQAVALRLDLRQTVRSTVTESSIVDATTWETHALAAAGPKEGAALRELVLEMAGRFVDDWRAVH